MDGPSKISGESNSSVKKVLVFGMTENPGGIESLLLNVLATVDSSRIHFDFIANTETVAYEDRLLEYGARIFKVTARRKNRREFYKDLMRIFNEYSHEYDAIWENVNSLGNIDYLVYAKRHGIPVRIIHAHNSLISEGFVRGALHRINRMRIRRVATHFWAASDEASQWFYGDDYKELPNYRVISNAIDLSRFKFDESARKKVRSSLGLAESDVLIGNVGRLHVQKNQELILRVVAELKKFGTPVHVVLVGQGELDGSLRRTAVELGISDAVHFVGVVEDSSSFYSAMDMFFFPSLYEGLGIALLEAQANGLPCLISDAIPDDAVWNSNVRAVSHDGDCSEWMEVALDLLKTGRVSKIELIGSRFDLSTWGDAFSELLFER